MTTLNNQTPGETGELMNQTDHDLLVRMDANIDMIKEHLVILNGRVGKAETVVQDHETRVTVIEKKPSPLRMVAWVGGIITLINGFIAYIRA